MAEDLPIPLEFLVDEAVLREKYQKALDGGASPEFAKSYLEEVTRSMVVSEAMTMTFSQDAINRVVGQAVTE